MSKQWTMVGGIVARLVLGAVALVKFGPKLEGVEVGKRAPNFTAVDIQKGDSVSLHSRATAGDPGQHLGHLLHSCRAENAGDGKALP
jgi:hypothetical protein